jgi:hypothetical protein
LKNWQKFEMQKFLNIKNFEKLLKKRIFLKKIINRKNSKNFENAKKLEKKKNMINQL